MRHTYIRQEIPGNPKRLGSETVIDILIVSRSKLGIKWANPIERMERKQEARGLEDLNRKQTLIFRISLIPNANTRPSIGDAGMVHTAILIQE